MGQCVCGSCGAPPGFGETSPELAVSIHVASGGGAARADARERCQALGEDVHCECEDDRCTAFRLEVPPDTALLLASTELPPAFIGLGDSMIAESELRDMAHALGALPAAPWHASVKPPQWGLVRYNRIEALSLGAKQELDLGRLRVEGIVRIGIGDWEPEAQLGVVRETGSGRFRLGGYRRLAEADPATKGLGLGNSLEALLFGRDDGEYFRATGVELTGAPALTRPQSLGLRVYFERQRAVGKETDFSIAHLFDKSEVFRPNLLAEPADQFGVALETHANRPLGTSGATLGADVTLEASGGDFDFVRSALTVRGNVSLAGLAMAVEIAGGTSAGTVPSQSLFFLGGPQTLRGYGGASVAGPAFWRARAELANAWPGARLALFADVGSTGSVERLSHTKSLIGVGIGASLMDGLLRIDVSRGLVTLPGSLARPGWRVDFYTDGIL